MSHYEAKMTSKGQITIPAGVREFCKLQPGDIVDFYVNEGERSVEIVARNKPASEMFGMLNAYLPADGKPTSVDDIDQAIGDHLAEEDERIQRQWRERQEFEAWKQARKMQAAE